MNGTFLGSDIAKLGFGMMRLPMKGESVDLPVVCDMVDAFLQAGFTYFDTAWGYLGGKSEVAAGEALVKRHPRASFRLATKLPIWEVKAESDLQRLFDTQLERTGAGYFDYYLLHALSADSLKTLDQFDIWGFAKQLKEKGLVRHIGFSFHDSAAVLEGILANHPEMEFVQLQINYVDWEDKDVQARACYELAMKYERPVIIMEPVRGGLLAGFSPEVRKLMLDAAPEKSVASWALRYCASLDGVITVLSGMSDMAQMQDNLSTFSPVEPLTAEERGVIDAVIARNAEVPLIPCTDCKYCVAGCPEKINIPGIFGAYNDLKVYQNLVASKGSYGWATHNTGKASACIACGACEERCPQHIPIIENLKEIAGVME